MIVKSISRHGGGAAPLIKYLFKYINKEHKISPKTKSTDDSRTMTSALACRNVGYKDLLASYAIAMKRAKVSFTQQDLMYFAWEHIEYKIYMLIKEKPKGMPTQLFIQQYDFDREFNLVKVRPLHENPLEKTLVIKHGVKSNTIQGFINEFTANEAIRIRKNKNRTTVNHVILSWGSLDRELISDDMLIDMAHEFFRLRGLDNKYVATKHLDKDHLHLHVAMSATKSDGTANRISKQEFAALKVQLQEYQKMKYPELTHSLPELGKSKTVTKGQSPQKPYISARTMSDKEAIAMCIERDLPKAHSVSEFLEAVRQSGFEVYYRNGTVQGIIANGLKHRLSKFGVTKERLQELQVLEEKENKALRELDAIRAGHSKEREEKGIEDAFVHERDMYAEREYEQKEEDREEELYETLYKHDENSIEDIEEMQ